MKQARLAAGWLKQKYTLLPLLAVALFMCFSMLLVPLASAAARSATWASSTTITSAGNTYTDAGNGTIPGSNDTYRVFEYKPSGSNTCTNYIYFNTSDDLSQVQAAKYYDQSSFLADPVQHQYSCRESDSGTITLTNTNANPSSSTTTGGGGGKTASTDGIDPCDAQADSPLSWFICPVIDLINGLISKLQSMIDNLLEFDIAPVFNTGTKTGAAYYTAWNSFRLFAIAFIVIVGLVMVIAQALGLDIFDAYTVKKVLPRLMIAAIGISLSWWLLKFLAQFTNALGIGIRSIIYFPFRNLGGSVLNTAGGDFLGILMGSAALFALGIPGILTLLGTAGLAILVAFLVLILRQMILVFLILLAPLAIACYVLPNTKKYYDLWWDSISKGFMMFPFITGFIAIGRVFAVVSANTTGGAGQGVNEVIGVIAFFLPYFALPFTFRLAGGALATIGGLANDRSRGMFDGLRKRRGAIMADRMKRAQNQSLWDNNSAIGKRANRVASWITDPVSNAALTKAGRATPGLRKRGNRLASVISASQTEQSMQLFEELNKMYGSNDKAYRVLAGQFGGMDAKTQQLLTASGFGSEAEGWKAPKSLGQLQQVSDILNSSDSTTERTAGAAIGASLGRLATLYQDPEMTKASTQAAGILGLAAHGFASGEDIAATANNMLDNGADMSFANSIAQQSQVLVARSRPDAKAGYGTTIENGRFVSGLKQVGTDGKTIKYKNADGTVNDDALGLRGFDVLKAVGPGDIAGAKGGLLKGVDEASSGIGDHLEFILRHGVSETKQSKEAFDEVSAMSPQEQQAFASTAEGQQKLQLAQQHAVAVETTQAYEEFKDKKANDPKFAQKIRDPASAEGAEYRRLQRLHDSRDLYTPMRDQLLQSASYYSHSSSDIKTGANDLLNRTGHGELLQAYDARRSAGHNPQEHEGGPEPDQGEQGH